MCGVSPRDDEHHLGVGVAAVPPLPPQPLQVAGPGGRSRPVSLPLSRPLPGRNWNKDDNFTWKLGSSQQTLSVLNPTMDVWGRERELISRGFDGKHWRCFKNVLLSFLSFWTEFASPKVSNFIFCNTTCGFMKASSLKKLTSRVKLHLTFSEGLAKFLLHKKFGFHTKC